MAEKKRIEPKDPEAVEPAAGARKAEQRATASKRKSVVNRKSVVRRKSTSRRKLG